MRLLKFPLRSSCPFWVDLLSKESKELSHRMLQHCLPSTAASLRMLIQIVLDGVLYHSQKAPMILSMVHIKTHYLRFISEIHGFGRRSLSHFSGHGQKFPVPS